jgi:hypothetical protein
MVPQIAHQFCISYIQVASDMLAILTFPFAVQHITLKDMSFMAINVINMGCCFEKGIDQRLPIFTKSLYAHFGKDSDIVQEPTYLIHLLQTPQVLHHQSP